MRIIERIQDLSSLPTQIRLQHEAYRAYSRSLQIPERPTGDPILQGAPMFYEHSENTPLMSVIAIWQYISDTPWQEWQVTGGKQAISVLYALINDYDDFLDSPVSRRQQLSAIEIQRGWRLGRADDDRPPFREMVHDLLWTFNHMGLSDQEKHYMLKKLAFLKRTALEETVRWEYGDRVFSLQSAKIVRERSCRPFGELTAAVLNGKSCLTTRGFEIEETMGTWFVAAQVLEDLLDVTEDIRQHNLSFVTGALYDNPEELAKIERRSRKLQKQLSVFEIKSLAPKSYSLIEKTFHEYLQHLPFDKRGVFLRATLRNTFYVLLPIKTFIRW